MAAIALLLISTGCLKLAGLKFSPIPAVGELSSPRLMLAVACWELVLGFWLLLAYDGASWLAAVATFTAFAAASAYFGMLGVSSCGCFGAVKASPWAAFALDLTVLALLITRSCLLQQRVRESHLLIVMLISAIGSWAMMYVRSQEDHAACQDDDQDLAVLVLPGEPCRVREPDGHGTASGPQMQLMELQISNQGRLPVYIESVESTCICVEVRSNPRLLGVGESLQVMAVVREAGEAIRDGSSLKMCVTYRKPTDQKRCRRCVEVVP